MRTAFTASALLLLVGCGGAALPGPASPGTEGAGEEADASSQRYEGVVRYAARGVSPTGATRAVEYRAARHVEIELLRGDAVVGRGSTDGEGRFEIAAGAGVTSVRVVARIEHDAHDLWVAGDRSGEEVYRYTHHVGTADADTPDASTSAPLAIDISDDDPGYAGAFHILDRMLDGSIAVRTWTGARLPGFFAYWGRGVTTDWSYYHGRCGRTEDDHYCIELLGGEPGQQATTDTDEHDDAIILHEFGHFVMDQLSTSSSHGGSHPGGYLIDPGLAWEEARASWFALAVMSAPLYQDTVGLEGSGNLRVNYNAERRGHGPRGQGSELGTLEILWDLMDGTEGLGDNDSDGVALGAAHLMNAMVSMRTVPGAYPTISSFLAYLRERGDVTREQLERVFVVGGHPSGLADPEQVTAWPRALERGVWWGGKIDSLTEPAPSGGPARPFNGFDAVHVFQVHLTEPLLLNATLEIAGSGRVQDRSDLDLELRNIRGDELAASRGESPTEAITTMLEPGYYLLYVRDGGDGNRASYRVRFTTGW